MSFPSLRAWLGLRRRPNAIPRRSTVRLELDRLEDRLVPATFVLSGTTLTVNGTPANDSFQFSETTTVTAGTLVTTYFVAMNDQTAAYTNAQVGEIDVFGLGGNDSATVIVNDTFTIPNQVTPQTLAYTIVGTQGGGYMLNSFGTQLLLFNGFQNSYYYAAPTDTGYLYTNPGPNNLLVTAGNYAYTSGSSEFHYINGAAFVFGYSTNPFSDTVYHYDAPGTNSFVASGNAYSYMSGNIAGVPYFNEAIGFNATYGIASQGTGDVATFYDSPGNDTFVGYAGLSALYGTNNGAFYFDDAVGFSHVYAYSFLGGVDAAYVYSLAINTVGGNFNVTNFNFGTGVRNIP